MIHPISAVIIPTNRKEIGCGESWFLFFQAADRLRSSGGKDFSGFNQRLIVSTHFEKMEFPLYYQEYFISEEKLSCAKILLFLLLLQYY
jgi:hypothetical protein